MEKIVRRVCKDDADTLAYIQIESWKAAYAGIIDDETLMKYTNTENVKGIYQKLLDNKKGNGYLLFIDDKPHCIAYWDAARDKELAGKAELICIHSLPNNWRKGCGSMMMSQVLKDMKDAGYSEVVLWVFRDNVRARAFYESQGFMYTDRSKPAFNTEEVLYAKTI